MTEILKLKNVSKFYYEIEKNISIFFPFLKKEHKNKKIILKDINFSVKSGESIGLIGQNGAGKSTLLKIISNTLKPSCGKIEVIGKTASILELGMGFNHELSGCQNAYHAMALMGFNKSQIDEKIEQIKEFSELDEYFNKPIRVYSSGMQMRLAFAVVTANRPDILIIDEALSVGDVYFQHKSFQKIHEFKTLGTTLIIVSHDASAIKAICDRVILIEKGEILKDGEPEAVLDFYNALISKKEEVSILQKKDKNGKTITVSGNSKANIYSLELLDMQNQKMEFIEVSKPIKLIAKVIANEDLDSLVFGYQIKNRFSQIIYGTNSFHLNQDLKNIKKGDKFEFIFEFLANFGVGSFSISVAIHSQANHLQNNYEWIDNAIVFSIVNTTKPEFIGLAYIEPKFKMEKISG